MMSNKNNNHDDDAQFYAVSFFDALAQASSKALNRTIQLESNTMVDGGGGSGGSGASTMTVQDAFTKTKYFVKSIGCGSCNMESESNMLHAEYIGIQELAQTNTIKVPAPIAFGIYHNIATENNNNNKTPTTRTSTKQTSPGSRVFVIFEYLAFTNGGSQYELGQQLAQLHRHTSPNHQFGFHVNNTIGATPQPNLPWMGHWADFWVEHRLGHMLRLTNDAGGLDRDKIQTLLWKTRELLSHNPPPSLLHGDLWGGNKGFCQDLVSGKAIHCIFDPATYYGDREADIAMTYVFGGFTNDFYNGYEDEWPLPQGHEARRTVYNLYHILNHDVLFGGGYLQQARGMIDKILNS